MVPLVAPEKSNLNGNQLQVLPQGVFQGLAAVKNLWLHDNSLTTLPQGVFEGLNNLTNL